jgi:hypothetical protein
MTSLRLTYMPVAMAAFTIASVSGVSVIFTGHPPVFSNDFHGDHIVLLAANVDVVAGLRTRLEFRMECSPDVCDVSRAGAARS